MTIGCCGQNREIAQLAAAADMHPRTTKAGQRARARLALALVERRALAAGDVAFAARARRSLGSLGLNTTSPTSSAALTRAVSRIRSARERPDGDALRARRDARIGRDVETYLGIAAAALSAIEAGVRAEALAETNRAAAEGRAPNYTAADTAKAFAWLRWMVGGPFPSEVAESDLRLFASIVQVAEPLMSAALEGGKQLALSAGNTGLQDALAAIQTYLRTVTATVRAAVAALPPPLTTTTEPPAEPPAEPPPRLNLTRVQWLSLSTTQRLRLIAAMNSGTPPEKSSSALLVLPAAALAWYLFM